MVDSEDNYFIQHFADIYFSKSVCISVCGGGGFQVSRTYCQVSLVTIKILKILTSETFAVITLKFDQGALTIE